MSVITKHCLPHPWQANPRNYFSVVPHISTQWDFSALQMVLWMSNLALKFLVRKLIWIWALKMGKSVGGLILLPYRVFFFNKKGLGRGEDLVYICNVFFPSRV